MFKQILFAGICLASLTGCVNAPYLGTDDMASVVEHDASNLNRAHARATNALILQNILRARDRWPAHYTTLGGVTLTPNTSVNGSLTLTPLGLGNPKGPFTGSGAAFGQTTKAAASYQINPYTALSRSESLLRPVPQSTLAYYWNQGWPKDVLFALFVESFTPIVTNDLDANEIINLGKSNSTFFSPSGSKKEYEKYLQNAKTAKVSVSGVKMEAVHNSEACPDIITGAATELVKTPKIKADDEDTLLVQLKTLNDAVEGSFHLSFDKGQFFLRGCADTSKAEKWEFQDINGSVVLKDYKLRSFDSMIYFIGETLRLQGDESNLVAAPSCDGGNSNSKKSRLFVVRDREGVRKTPGIEYAAVVRHAGRKYYALPEYDYEVGGLSGVCHEERTSTVMSILTQLFLLNQSDAFLKAPDNILLQR